MLSARQIQQLRREPTEPNRLKAAMRIAGVTQNDVAAATGMRQANVSRVANASGLGVTVHTAAKLAHYFGCEIADLFPAQAAVAA